MHSPPCPRPPRYGFSLCKVAQLGCSANSQRIHLVLTTQGYLTTVSCYIAELQVPHEEVQQHDGSKHDGSRRSHSHPGSGLKSRLQDTVDSVIPVLLLHFSLSSSLCSKAGSEMLLLDSPASSAGGCLLYRLIVTFDSIDRPQPRFSEHRSLHCWPTGLQPLPFASIALFPGQPLSPKSPFPSATYTSQRCS